MNSNEPIRILNIVPNMNIAGIETLVMNLYRNIDRNKVQFDFIVHNKDRKSFDNEIEELGGKIYRFSLKDDKNIIKYIIDLNKFFKEHKEYKVIHGHMQSMMPLYLYLAKKNEVPIRIAHAHNGSYEKTLKGFILHIFSRFASVNSNCNIACSEVAGRYLFKNKEFKTIYNGIDESKFKFDDNIRKSKRIELGLKENEFVILHVGRFELQKNHKYLIDVFEKFYETNKNAKLLLVGEGKLKKVIKQLVKEKQLEKNVIFLGVRKDVNEIMCASDCFVLPSLYEGLPVVGVEAQISGLPCVFSNSITQEVKINENTIFLDNNNLQDYVDKLNEFNNSKVDRVQNMPNKFNISIQAKILEELYLKSIDKLNEKSFKGSTL